MTFLIALAIMCFAIIMAVAINELNNRLKELIEVLKDKKEESDEKEDFSKL
jgi:hypothetical protein